MSQTLKQMLDTVLLESGMPTETSYADNGDDAVKRLVNIANRSIRTLSQWPWQALRMRYTLTLGSETQYALPSDFRQVIPDTLYEDSRLWAMDFPASVAEWNYLKSSSGGTGPRTKARLIGDVLEIYQPVSGVEIAFEYLTNAPVLDTDGLTKKERFDADTDTCLLDDDLVEMDITWRYKKLMGLEDWQADAVAFKAFENYQKGIEAGAQTITPGEDTFQSPYYNLWRPVPNDP